jgi:hypothetical protein
MVSMPALISEDARWWWDGNRWRSRLVEGELDLLWFTSTPDWLARVLVTGLIALIPIAGAINLLGWTLAATDMVRGGWKELPPAGFQHLQRGVAPFVVGLVYGLGFAVVATAMVVVLVVIATSGRTGVAIAIVLGLVVVLFTVAWWLVSLYLFAAVLMAADSLGIGRAMNPLRLFALAGANRPISLRVGLLYAGASLVFAIVSLFIGLVVPFSGLLAPVALPAVYAMVAPHLAGFRIERPSAGSAALP